MSKNKYNDYRFVESYPDPTAGEAIEHVIHDEKLAEREKNRVKVRTDIERLKPRTRVWRKKDE